MFYVFWTCPNCNRNHRFVWNDAESQDMVEGYSMHMVCGETEDRILGLGCGHSEKLTVIASSMPIEGHENGFAVMMNDHQLLDNFKLPW